MRASHQFFLILLIKLLSLINKSIANEVLGCGGFIKSHADIDFSKVEIKLFTKQGALKDKSDCSPSNGYYFVPIYDKGEYLLKISPPPGWSFEPEQVELNFDGANDICSQGKDVNFVFKGFGITGKVALAGNTVGGAKNVQVVLKSEDGDDLRQTETDINGIFSFTPIIPGKYIVKASHPKWHFSKSEHIVQVTKGNTELPNDALVVAGFDVIGKFDTFDPLPNGLGVAIFNKKGQTFPLACEQIEPKPLAVEAPDFESISTCYTKVAKNGLYNFKGIPPGQYLLQPIAENNMQLFFNRKSIEITVTKDTLEVLQKFKIKGFSISGKVLKSANGAPMAGAAVMVNGRQMAESDVNGVYTLKSIKPDFYKIQVEAPKLQFEEKEMELELDSTHIPPIYPTAFEVCGQVMSEQVYSIGVSKLGSTFYTKTTSNEHGEWCVFLGTGKYAAEVLTSTKDQANGVQFYPLQQKFEVKFEPITGLVFSQLRAKLSGEIKCLDDAPEYCLNSDVVLNNLDLNGRPTNLKLTTKSKDGHYMFEDILPGTYMITIPQTNLCFDVTRVQVNVASATVTASPFVQKGYEIKFSANRRAILKYQYENPKQKQQSSEKENEEGSTASLSPPSNPIESLRLVPGMNTICVSEFGTYNFKIESCHLFDADGPTSFTTASAEPVVLNAYAHKTGIRVLSTESELGDIQLSVETISLGKSVVKPVAEAHKVDDKYAFRYDTYLKPNEALKIIPQSKNFLFEPQQKEIIGGNDCIDIAFNFIATRGLILRGKVVPPIKDVEITLTFPKNPEYQDQTAMTLINGEFTFGPIHSHLEFDMKAEKESYVFSAYNRQSATFNAHKLCEIIVNVRDEAGEPLNGVLLSLSGSESYRKNLITGDEGLISFHSLSPSQYFLRPMMKEYKFEPNSKMIDIKDGETIEIELIGKRHAFSVFGMITSPNGNPFSGINVEAISDENCLYHQEEATSEINGQYRIRGLQPGCSYTVYLKDAGKPKSNVVRSMPKNQKVQIVNDDVKNVNLIAFPPLEICDVTVHIQTENKEHYKTLRLIMYRKGEMDSPIFSQKVDSPLNMKSLSNTGLMYFMPRIPLDGKTYVLELRSTLSEKTYKYVTPVQTIIADMPSIFVDFEFTPTIRTSENDIKQNSIGALMLLALVAIAFFRQDIAMGVLDYLWSKVSTISQDVMLNKQKPTTPASSKKDKKLDAMNQKEIDQLAEQINSIKKKKTKKI